MELFLGLDKHDLMRALVAGQEHVKSMRKHGVESPEFTDQLARYHAALEVLEKM